MRFVELKKRLAAGDVNSVYLLTGQDEYLRSSALRQISALALLPELNVVRLDAPSSRDVRDAVLAVPMMSDRRVVIADGLTEADALDSYVSAPTPTTVLVLTNVSERAAGRKKASPAKTDTLRRLLSIAEEIDCSPPDERVIFAWMAAESKKFDVTVERDAAALLTEYCRNDMSRITSEFDKLAAYREGGRLTVSDVRDLVEPETDYAVWQLSGAVASGDAARAMEIFRSFDDDASRPEVLFGVLNNHFRKLYYSLLCDDGDLKKYLGMNERAMFAVRREARKFGTDRLARILLSLAQADEDIKNGAIPRDVASEILILKTVGEV